MELPWLSLLLALPLLVTLCLTSVDFGRYIYAAIALDNAVRISAEYGATRQLFCRYKGRLGKRCHRTSN